MKKSALFFRDPNFRRLLRFVLPYRQRLVFALLCMIGYGATDGVVPLLIRSILDDVFGNRDERMLYVLPAVLVGFAVVRGTFGFLQQYLMSTVGLRIVRDLRNRISRHLLTLSPSFFDRNSTGTLISRVTNDSLLVRQALTDAVTSVLRDSVRVLALLATAIYLDPVLGVIAFVGFPLGLIPVLRFGKKVRKFSRSGQDQFGGLTGALHEAIVGHSVVHAFSLEDPLSKRFEQENDDLTRTLMKAEKYGALSGPTNEIIACVVIGGVILYGGLSVIGGVRTQGDFIAFVTALFLLYEPLKKLSRTNTIFQTGLAAAERIFEVLDTAPEISNRPGATAALPQETTIRFENVSFRYASQRSESAEGQSEWALRNVNLVVPAGTTLALVGMSGGGKSTLARLVPRFYDVDEGRVTLGGQDIRSYTLESLRGGIALVSQHTFLFNDTVARNIAFGRLGATQEEIVEAARAANAYDFIMRLPQGFETSVGEQGQRLSGGERARIAIARALLRNAPILILDEATAALDSESERAVQQAIDRLMKDRTAIVIAHRLATVRNANAIAVFSRGQVVEFGTHNELMSRGGEYAKLCAIQFQTEGTESVSFEQEAVHG